MKTLQFCVATLAATILLAPATYASPIVAVLESPDDAPGVPQPVSSFDLVDEASPVLLTENWADHSSFSGSTPDVLNDGSPGGAPDGGWNTNANEGAVTTQKTPWTLTYTLDTSSAPYGFEITQIEAMSLWIDDYVNQHYSVSVSTISNPAFTSLIADVTATEQDLTPGDNASSLKTVITDTTGVLASNVTGIQFVFETQPQAHAPVAGDTLAAYKEVDVFGYVSAPEPAGCTLGAIGLGLIAALRRRTA